VSPEGNCPRDAIRQRRNKNGKDKDAHISKMDHGDNPFQPKLLFVKHLRSNLPGANYIIYLHTHLT
jgi:hypothetical protein